MEVKIKGSGDTLGDNDNFIIGYNGVVKESIDGDGDGGPVGLLSTAVPAGYLYIITNVCAKEKDTNEVISLIVRDELGESYRIDTITQAAIADGVVFKLYQPIILPAEYYLEIGFADTEDGDELEAVIFGYKMKVA
jgi:hypothetical protein